MMSFMRLIVGAGLFAFGYYLGRQSGRLEALHSEFDPYSDTDSVPESGSKVRQSTKGGEVSDSNIKTP